MPKPKPNINKNSAMGTGSSIYTDLKCCPWSFPGSMSGSVSDRNISMKGERRAEAGRQGPAIQGLVSRVKESELYRAMESH